MLADHTPPRLALPSLWLAAALGAMALASCGGPQVAGNLVSGKQEFSNTGCEGLVFDARVSGNVAVLGVTELTEESERGASVASFAFDLETSRPTRTDPILVDEDPPAKAFLKGDDQVCFQFGKEDKTPHACFQSLISTGAFCLKLHPETSGAEAP